LLPPLGLCPCLISLFLSLLILRSPFSLLAPNHLPTRHRTLSALVVHPLVLLLVSLYSFLSHPVLSPAFPVSIWTLKPPAGFPLLLIQPRSVRTRISHRDLRDLLVAQVPPKRRYGNQHDRSRAAHHDGVKVRRLVDGRPSQVSQRLLEEEWSGWETRHGEAKSKSVDEECVIDTRGIRLICTVSVS
jgi:hypothetical protein